MIAYEGNEPYVFISYAHKDRNLVLPIIDGLQNRGFRVWYDEGIEVGFDWTESIAKHLSKSSCVLAFISSNFDASHNCRREISFAIKKRKEPMVIYMEDEEKLSEGMQMQLCPLHAMYLDRYAGNEVFLDALSKAALLKPCLGEIAVPVSLPAKSAALSAEELFIRGSTHLDRKEYAEAVRLLREAADQGHMGAQNNLACCYQNGDGVNQDRAEAAKWFRKAAEQGAAYAQNNLGWCYENGNGVLRNYVEAAKWYQKAAEQGDAPAQRNLGWCYEKGNGVPRNYVEAVKWFQRAAEQGEIHAQYSLGYCYEFGKGVPKDEKEAIKWYQKAADQGHESAIDKFKTLQ